MGADMQPGPEMDRLVAEAVGMDVYCPQVITDAEGVCFRCGTQPWGARRVCVRPFSTSDSDALAALVATNEEFSIHRDSCHQEGWRWVVEIFGRTMSRADCETIPEAACRAILAWREAEKDG